MLCLAPRLGTRRAPSTHTESRCAPVNNNTCVYNAMNQNVNARIRIHRTCLIQRGNFHEMMMIIIEKHAARTPVAKTTLLNIVIHPIGYEDLLYCERLSIKD